jgi:hypothetical protein
MAAGCSAETGEPEAAEIGSTAEALSVSSTPTDLPTTPTDLRFYDGAACRLYDSAHTTEYIAIAGGITNSASPVNQILLAPRGGTWVKQTATLGVARSGARAIQLSDTRCAIVGGDNGTSGDTKVEILELTSGSPATVALSATITPAALNNGRAGHEVSTCVDNSSKTHLVVFGGGTDVIEVSDDVSKATWSAWTSYSSAGSKLLYSPLDFAMAKNPSANQYMVAGGKPVGGTYSNKINFITMSTACAPTVLQAKQDASHATDAVLSESVRGNVGFYQGNTDYFISTAGTKDVSGTETLTTVGQLLHVTDWTNGYVAVSQPSEAGLTTGAYRPSAVQAGSNAFLIGGKDKLSPTDSVQAVQEYTPSGAGTGSKATSTLSASKAFAPGAVYFSIANTVGVAGGIDFPSTYTAQVDELTP